jgi:hypothetical protein
MHCGAEVTESSTNKQHHQIGILDDHGLIFHQHVRRHSASDWVLGRAVGSAEAPRRGIAQLGGTYLIGGAVLRRKDPNPCARGLLQVGRHGREVHYRQR